MKVVFLLVMLYWWYFLFSKKKKKKKKKFSFLLLFPSLSSSLLFFLVDCISHMICRCTRIHSLVCYWKKNRRVFNLSLWIYYWSSHTEKKIEDQIRSNEHAKRKKHECVVIILYRNQKNIGYTKELPVNRHLHTNEVYENDFLLGITNTRANYLIYVY